MIDVEGQEGVSKLDARVGQTAAVAEVGESAGQAEYRRQLGGW